jgi:pimeloyl-ACP methyl ester carboxylesterase
MSRRLSLLIAVILLILTIGGAISAVAQDATPVAVDPPQDLLPDFTDEVAGETVEINGASIYYEIYGKGEPLILLHGGLGNGKYWVNQIPVFAENYQVIVMDSRGHGRSSFDEQPITYQLMASDVLALMDHLSIEQASIVGWSDGGIIGLEIAINNPDRLNKVVAYGANFDPTGVRLDIATNNYFNAFIERAAEDYMRLSPAPDRWEEFLNNIGTMWATLPNYTEAQLRSITTPFLVLDGQDEEAIDLNQTKLMALLIPGAELNLMPGTGHFAMFEQPEKFNATVMDYLSR